MILVVCQPCQFAIRVLGGAGEDQEVDLSVGRRSDFWPDRFNCPRCDGKAHGLLEVEADPTALSLLEVRDLTPQEAVAAFHGLGLPEEMRCSKAIVQQLLTEVPIRRIVGVDVEGASRTVLDSLELWDGTRLYFGASPDGAVIYRIARPATYTARALLQENA